MTTDHVSNLLTEAHQLIERFAETRDAALTDDRYRCERWLAAYEIALTEQHVIQFTDSGWTIMHPLHERLAPESLFACEMRWADGDIGYRGRYVLNDDGTLGAVVQL